MKSSYSSNERVSRLVSYLIFKEFQYRWFGPAFSLFSLLICLLPSSIWPKAKLHSTDKSNTIFINWGRPEIPGWNHVKKFTVVKNHWDVTPVQAVRLRKAALLEILSVPVQRVPCRDSCCTSCSARAATALCRTLDLIFPVLASIQTRKTKKQVRL